MKKEKRTYADRAEYIKAAVSKRRKALRERAVQSKGTKCQLCGYNKYTGALEFHHFLNQKNFGISETGCTRSWANIEKELDLRVLLCANCHHEVEAGITQLSVEKMD